MKRQRMIAKTTDCTHFCFLFVCTTWLLTRLQTKVVVSLFFTMEVETFSDTEISFNSVYIRKEDICSLIGYFLYIIVI